MKKNNFTFRQKMKFNFDNFMSGGVKSQLIGLSTVVMILVILFSIPLILMKSSDKQVVAVFWDTLIGLLRPARPTWSGSKDGLELFITLAMLVTAMTVMAMLTGILVSSFRSLVTDLARHASRGA